jgi:hypothetical protein
MPSGRGANMKELVEKLCFSPRGCNYLILERSASTLPLWRGCDKAVETHRSKPCLYTGAAPLSVLVSADEPLLSRPCAS